MNSDSRVAYGLNLKSVTADLGVVVHRKIMTSIQSSDELFYLIETAADGSFSASISKSGSEDSQPLLELIDPNTLSVLADNRSREATIAVKKSQKTASSRACYKQ